MSSKHKEWVLNTMNDEERRQKGFFDVSGKTPRYRFTYFMLAFAVVLLVALIFILA